MSTRAIITVQSKTQKLFGEDLPAEVVRLYCHGDGYPSYLGMRVHNFLNVVKSMGQSGKVWKSGYSGGVDRPGGYVRRSPRGRAFSAMANVLWDPGQFVPALTTYLHNKGYGGTYLTDRDPEKEVKRDWTDIEWHYVITLPPYYKNARPKLEVYELGDKRFIKKSASVPELAEQEKEERRRNMARYEKERKAAERKETKAQQSLKGVR